MSQTVAELQDRLSRADTADFAVLERALCADTRKGVVEALRKARVRLEREREEADRLASLYAFQSRLAPEKLIVGLDEVGRGPLAGPLAIGAVILPEEPLIPGLDDSKKISPDKRNALADEIKETALAWAVVYVQPRVIDSSGMTFALRQGFRNAVKEIEAKGWAPKAVLLDGNPLHMDAREISVVKGDAKCASIAAASIIAKAERDALMCEYAEQYPEYGLDANKGYGSMQHREAISDYGLTPIHRVSFCTSFMQESLF